MPTPEHFWHAAADYIARGWPVVLVHAAPGGRCTCGRANCKSPAKHPLARSWSANAIRDAEGLAKARAAAGDREYNLALLLGAESGIVDVEFDTPEGAATAARLLGDIDTPAYTSARSTHRLFRWSPALGAKAVHHVAGLEIRAGGGGRATASLLPPSRHASGVDYAWLPGLSPAEVELACFPEAVLELLRAPLTPAARELAFTVIADLESDPGAAAGSRREALARLVGRHLREHGVTPGLMGLVDSWCRRCSPPFAEDEAAALVNSLALKDLARAKVTSATITPPPAAAKHKLRLRPLAEVADKQTDFLFGKQLVAGYLSVLAGHGGEGKTFLATELAARLSRGEATPLGGTVLSASSLLVSAEDSEAILRRRVAQAGGDLDRVCILAEDEEFLSFAIDTDRLRAALDDRPDIKFLVFDSLGDFLGGADDSSNGAVRGALRAIKQLAADRQLAVLAISHFSKGASSAGNRLLGSVSFRNLPRSVSFLVRDPDDENARLLLHQKHNLSEPDPVWRFHLVTEAGATRIRWEPEPSGHTKDDIERLLTGDQREARTYKPTRIEAAMKLLGESLEPGTWTNVADVLAIAKAAGVPKTTVYEAATRLGVEKRDGWWRKA